MPVSSNTVMVEIVKGSKISVPWQVDMTVLQALEGAYNAEHDSSYFTYALQYFGLELGNLVIMINGTYESFMSSADPFYYWEFFVNDAPGTKGVDHTKLNAGDTVTFELQVYNSKVHIQSTVQAKHNNRYQQIQKNE